jgi:hypothetical protein
MPILIKNGIPEHLQKYKEDIEHCVKYKTSFRPKSEIINMPRWNQNTPLPDGFIETISLTPKIKYCYIEGRGDGRKIEAKVPFKGGLVRYTINSFGCLYDLQTHESEMPDSYFYMEQAIINWLVDEYNKIKKSDSPDADKVLINFNPRPTHTHISPGEIKTIAITKAITDESGMIMYSNGEINVSENNNEYFYVTAKVGRDFIEAYIFPDDKIIHYSINQSKTYSYDVNPIVSETEGALGVKLIITADMSSEFPRRYKYMEEAFFFWIKEVLNSLQISNIIGGIRWEK